MNFNFENFLGSRECDVRCEYDEMNVDAACNYIIALTHDIIYEYAPPALILPLDIDFHSWKRKKKITALGLMSALLHRDNVIHLSQLNLPHNNFILPLRLLNCITLQSYCSTHHFLLLN